METDNNYDVRTFMKFSVTNYIGTAQTNVCFGVASSAAPTENQPETI